MHKEWYITAMIHRMAEALMEGEALNSKDIDEIMGNGEKIILKP